MSRTRSFVKWSILALALSSLVALGCGGDDDGGTGPTNSPPEFRKLEVGDKGLLHYLVPGDRVDFTALAVDPDVEPVSYSWEILAGNDPAPVSAGTLEDADTKNPVWVVGTFSGPLGIRCTISDGEHTVSRKLGAVFYIGTRVAESAITQDTTWSVADGPRVLMDDLVIEAGATLTLEAGVELYVRPILVNANYVRKRITVRGNLVTQGDPGATNHVKILGAYRTFASGDQHAGIRFEEGGGGDLTGVILKNAEIAVSFAVQSTSPGVTIRESTLGENQTAVLVNADGTLSISGNTYIEKNSIGLQVNRGNDWVEECALRQNTAQAIFLNSTDVGGAHVEVWSSNFSDNGSHLHARSSSGSSSANFKRCNLDPDFDEAPMIRLDCQTSLVMNLRGNHWGMGVQTGTQIKSFFVGGADCVINVSGWTDSDCNATGDPDCDFRLIPFETL